MLPYRSEGKEVQVDVNEYFNAYHSENISLFILITVLGGVEGNRIILFHNTQNTLDHQGNQCRNWRQESEEKKLMQKPWMNAVYWLTGSWSAQFAFYKTQDYLSMGDTTNIRLDALKSIISQDSALQGCLQASIMEVFSQLLTLAFGKLLQNKQQNQTKTETNE